MTGDYLIEGACFARVASRIVDEVQGINRIVYDNTSKPRRTIEWQ